MPAQLGVPLLEILLGDLKEHARKHGVPVAAQHQPVAAATPAPKETRPASWFERAFQTN